MKKMLRIMLVWMFVISSLTSIGVSAAPEDPDAPDVVKVYMPFVVRQVTYNISGTVTDANGEPACRSHRDRQEWDHCGVECQRSLLAGFAGRQQCADCR